MLYTFARHMIWLLARLFLRIRVVGAEHLPKGEGLLFAPNHVSFLDIPMLGVAVDRPLHFVGKASLFRGRWVGWLYRNLNGIALQRGPASRVGLMEAVRRLKDGRSVVLYPEGARSLDGRLQIPRPGIGMVAALSGAKVIPVYISGTDRALPVGAWRIRSHPVTVYIGEPMHFGAPNESIQGKEYYNQISRSVMERIISLEARAREGTLGWGDEPQTPPPPPEPSKSLKG